MTDVHREDLLKLGQGIEPYVDPLLARAPAIGLATLGRWAHFLAQTGHESAGFTRVAENLNYSATALRKVFPRYFTDDETAAAYHRQPARIASRVYANRLGNGSEVTGDGWRFRGRGLIQVTGRDNYRVCSIALFADERLLQVPELLEKPEHAVASAGWFWVSRDLNALADRNDLVAITKKINGGVNGLQDRQHWLERCAAVIGWGELTKENGR